MGEILHLSAITTAAVQWFKRAWGTRANRYRINQKTLQAS
jgi:hypothetical protein